MQRPARTVVLHVITSLDVGGAELALKRVVLADTRSADIHHVVVSLKEAGVVGRELEDAGVTVSSLRMGSMVSTLTAIPRLARLIRHLSPDVIQTWMYHADLLGGVAAKLSGHQRVIWGIRNTGFAPQSSRITRAIMHVCAWLSHSVPKLIVCCADSARLAHVARGYSASKMRVIPNGFALPLQDDLRRWRAEMRARLGMREGEVVIGMVARFDPLKDHRAFIRAAGAVAHVCDNVRVLLVGREVDSANETLSRWIAEAGIEGRTTLLGERRDVVQCLAAMDVFCLSSLMEAFPNVVGEAMAAGLPCVVTDAGDAAGIVGTTGWVVKPGDWRLLADQLLAVVQLSAEERRVVGASARLRIRDHFTMDAVHRQFRAAYADVLNPGCS